ncbi:MAG: 6-bladed beta-propeller [Balneolaceae bacterium]|nr:6-bladed beta-propeller [Balneolaceae bacterium]TVR16747.1 MAG: 6-bladed beta-propeller [Balneolaceae bacterium]
MLSSLLFVLVFLSSFLSYDFLVNDKDKKDVVIILKKEFVIKDSEDFFIQNISDAAITPIGHIIFLSSRQHRAFVFDENGDFLQSFGNQGRGPAEFNRPSMIEVGPDGTIFIHDPRNSRISVWNLDYEHEAEFEFMRGWNTYFINNSQDIFIWSQPHQPLPNGSFALILFKIEKSPWRAEIFRTFEYVDHNDQHEFLSTWSNIEITDQGNLIATEGTDEGSYFLYIVDEYGEMINKFGRKVDQPMHTPERSTELQQMRIRAGIAENDRATGSRSSTSGGQAQSELVPKPYFINLEIDSNNYLWVHRNKEFGQQEEIDIYTLKGEYKTTVTIPPTENEYRLLGIYDERVLFRVTEPDETPSLHVYRIEYVE